jgi:putative membrane protein
MELLKIFPHLNATLNAASGVLLILGLFFILTRRFHAHRASMLGASAVSVLFLISYVSHHVLRTSVYGLGPTRFTGEGLARPIYFTILTSHTVLAALVGPFIVATLWRALKGNFDAHRRLARVIYPVWLYVSITGVAVYLMLYQLFPSK